MKMTISFVPEIRDRKISENSNGECITHGPLNNNYTCALIYMYNYYIIHYSRWVSSTTDRLSKEYQLVFCSHFIF